MSLQFFQACLLYAGELKAIDYYMDDGSLSPFPVLQCRNVYVLPGVPHLLRKKWAVSAPLRPLLQPASPWLHASHFLYLPHKELMRLAHISNATLVCMLVK